MHRRTRGIKVEKRKFVWRDFVFVKIKKGNSEHLDLRSLLYACQTLTGSIFSALHLSSSGILLQNSSPHFWLAVEFAPPPTQSTTSRLVRCCVFSAQPSSKSSFHQPRRSSPSLVHRNCYVPPPTVSQTRTELTPASRTTSFLCTRQERKNDDNEDERRDGVYVQANNSRGYYEAYSFRSLANRRRRRRRGHIIINVNRSIVLRKLYWEEQMKWRKEKQKDVS